MAHPKVKFAETEFVVSPLTFWLIIVLALLLAVAITLALAFYTIPEGEVALVSRLGKFYKLSVPGIHWRLPWGIDRIERLKVAYPHQIDLGFNALQTDSGTVIRQAKPNESRLITADLYLTDVFWTLTYKISDPVKYVYSSQNPEAILKTLGIAAMRKAVGQHTLQELFQTQRVEITTAVQQELQSNLRQIDLGIAIQSVELKQVLPLMQDTSTGFVAPAPAVKPETNKSPAAAGTDTTSRAW